MYIILVHVTLAYIISVCLFHHIDGAFKFSPFHVYRTRGSSGEQAHFYLNWKTLS